MGQNQLQNVFIHLSTNGDQIEVDVILAGPGAQQIQDLDVTLRLNAACAARRLSR